MEEMESDFDDTLQSSGELNQLACCLKNAIFSKYISNYLIEKTEEVKARMSTQSLIFIFHESRCGFCTKNVSISI